MPRETKEPHTKESLLAMSESLQDLASQLRSVAELVEGYDLAPLTVTNATQRKLGMEYLDKFVAAARSAVRMAREDRGHFGSVAKNGSTTTRKKPPK